MKPVRTLLTFALALAILGSVLSCALLPAATSVPPPTRQPTKPSQPQPAAEPNLAIVSVHVAAQPQAGQRFTVVVYVTNNGNAPSGDYDLVMHIKDISHGYTYPGGTFRQDALYPGEQVSWQTDAKVDELGSYQIWLEIIPFLFEDGNQQDNTYIWAFQVSQ